MASGITSIRVFVTAVVLCVSGCGGGGSGVSDPGPPGSPSSTTGVELTGSVVKGPVSNAFVQAVCHDKDSAEPVGSTQSDAYGKYTLNTTSACASVIELQVSAGAYVDEATGATVTGPLSPWLRSLIDAAAPGAKRTAHITALTDLLYAKTTTSGASRPNQTLLATAEKQLLEDIKLIITTTDIDPVKTAPSIVQGSAATDAGVAYSLLLAAVAKLSNGSVDGMKTALVDLSAKGMGGSAAFQDAMNSVVSSSEVLSRLGINKNVAENLVATQFTLPAMSSMLSAGDDHSLAVASDGSVWAWGYNGYGGLGDGTYTARYTPTRVLNLTEVIAVSAGQYHSIALKSDGTVWAWGEGQYGQLGQGTDTGTRTPVKVPTLTDIVAISTRGSFSLALRRDGSVWAWGVNGAYTIGDGTTTARHTPVQVSKLTNIMAISAGFTHSLALQSDGSVWAWGYSYYGGLGTEANSSPTPIKVADLSNVIAISTGDYHSLALKSNGTVWAWGYNGNGALGYGTGQSSYKPVQVSNLTGVQGIEAGNGHSLAIKKDGTAWAWGGNVRCRNGNAESETIPGGGQLGDGTTTSRYTPVQVLSLNTLTAVAAGGCFSLALKSDGTVWSWGDNQSGALGDATTTDRYSPIQIPGLSLGASTNTSSGGATDRGTAVLNYDELVKQSSRLFTGKSFDVRVATDNLDLLFPSGIVAGTEPSWPGIRFGSIVSGIGCVDFDFDKYIYYLGKFQQANADFRASDYEAVGRRGYEVKITLAVDNLVYWYGIRTKVDPVNHPTLVCFKN